jgi:hypothetical protein
MKIKWNWGTGIFLAIVAMLSFIGFLVYTSFQHEVNKVSDDYYERGLSHSEYMSIQERSRPMNAEFDIIYTDNCTIQFPQFFKDKKVSGNVLFFRPSDFNMDKTFVIEMDSSARQVITINEFLKGKYIVKVDMETDSLFYHFEQDIIFN